VNSEVLKKKQEYDSRVAEQSHTHSRIANGNYGTIGVGANLRSYNNDEDDEDDEDEEEEKVDVNIGKLSLFINLFL